MMRVHHFLAIAALVATTTMCGGGGSSTGPSNSAGTASGTGTPDDPYYSGTGNGCGSVSAGSVCIGFDLTFNPVSVTITHGSAVTFVNGTGATHNVTFDPVAGAPANVANFSSGSQPVTFNTPGTYPYHCAIHGLSMHGTVVVQ